MTGIQIDVPAGLRAKNSTGSLGRGPPNARPANSGCCDRLSLRSELCQPVMTLPSARVKATIAPHSQTCPLSPQDALLPVNPVGTAVSLVFAAMYPDGGSSAKVSAAGSTSYSIV